MEGIKLVVMKNYAFENTYADIVNLFGILGRPPTGIKENKRTKGSVQSWWQ